MATMTLAEHRKTNLTPFLFIAVALSVLFLALSAPSHHATQNHGTYAWNVTQRFKGVDPDDDDVWSDVCPDGRKYTFRELSGGNAWDVSIDDPLTGINITRFTSKSRNWIARKLLWCE